MIPASRLAVIGLAASMAGAPAANAADEWARYRFATRDAWRQVHAVEDAGYRVALSAPDGVTLEARVEVDGRPLVDEAAFPVEPGSLPPEARAVLGAPPLADEEADALARTLTRGSRTELEAVERVVAFTSRRIRYERPREKTETARSARISGQGSCVGRSLLAADLLLRVGVPARQVSGVLVADGPDRLGPESRALFDETLGGVRHRWIEVFVPRLGWVPSDPGGLANTVTARHLALAEPPGLDFSIETLGGSQELKHPALPTIGSGLTLARPRGASLVVTNGKAGAGGAVVLAPEGVAASSGDPRVKLRRADSAAVTFEGVPPGTYRVLWREANGHAVAASVTVTENRAAVDLGAVGEAIR